MIAQHGYYRYYYPIAVCKSIQFAFAVFGPFPEPYRYFFYCHTAFKCLYHEFAFYFETRSQQRHILCKIAAKNPVTRKDIAKIRAEQKV